MALSTLSNLLTSLFLRAPRPPGERYLVSNDGWIPDENQLILEPILHKLTFAIFGTSHRDFTFTAGKTFLSSDAQVAAGIVTYLSLVFGGKYLMSQREPYKLKTLFFWHNIILVAVSAVLLLLMLEVIVPMFWHHGFFWSICDSRAYGKHLEYLYYFNYLIKWWELLDTMFLVAKKKPLEFLHVYHHAATMLLTFVELKGQTAVQWVPIVLNLFVHVVMYYYYAWTSVGKKFWWKRHLTTLQITQFIIDIFVIYLVMWTHMSASRNWPVWHLGDCYGEEFAGFVGMGIISSYLYLFVVLFVETYILKTRVRGSTSATGKANGAATNGVANGKAAKVGKSE